MFEILREWKNNSSPLSSKTTFFRMAEQEKVLRKKQFIFIENPCKQRNLMVLFYSVIY